ncbi:scavenger receptor class F member 1 isoform X2 [Bombina bombina]|uniref:scavenger receptor class F member 1 isoform X2 n=1 Tax=Bombina bombina TaxID=8345 RepID=UPI00235AECA3|nr:scavenger receptor class F member 1 isoform X2 [Bombina bombina]
MFCSSALDLMLDKTPVMVSRMRTFNHLLFLWSWLQGVRTQHELDPHGINVCKSDSITQELVCCPGWKQEGRACTTACPNQYWGSDCKQSCSCYPYGKCDAVTGQCTCNANRWGPKCQHSCHCSRHGMCNPLTGSCQCEPGWWSFNCNKTCHCNLPTSRCNPATGQCICDNGWWGQKCSVRCNCNKSPCLQISGKCKCQEGWWGVSCEHRCSCVHGKCNPVSGECDCDVGYQGKTCADLCTAGTYGPKCKIRCGQCKDGQPCSPVDGFCHSCESGWNGTLCDQPCLPGYYGENCVYRCPKCRGEETCNRETGNCTNCDTGKIGPRCESTCPAGNYGDKCQMKCTACVHGNCNPFAGECICEPGYWQNSCNETCPEGLYGPNCSEICECGRGYCSPHYGTCELTSGQKGAIVAGVLVPLLLLCFLCCCCCCGDNQSESKDRVSSEGNSLSRMKHNFQGALANISSVLPCCLVGNSKVSWVTVSHHDAELPFNHSFIESPSTGWLSENSFSSFESDEDGPVYCVPPTEGISIADMDGFQEISSKCNVFPESLAFNSEDVSQPFSIPRTSSIAKAKRPSVSFAEGTKFESRRSSTDTPNLLRKPKLALSLPKLPSVQKQSINGEELQDCVQTNEHYENVNICKEPDDHPKLQRIGPVGRRRTMSNAQNMTLKAEIVESGLRENINEMRKKNPKISTVYVSVGHPRKLYKPRRKSEGNVDGAVQAVLKRLGSFQKGIPKPVRRNVSQTPNFRSSQSKISCEEDLKINSKSSDPSFITSSTKLSDNLSKNPLNPASSMLKKLVPNAEETESVGSCDKMENTYSYLPDHGVLLEQTQNVEHIYHSAEGTENIEPKYENISITHCLSKEIDTSGIYEDAEMISE